MRSVVVDASAALGWLLKSQRSEKGIAFLEAADDRAFIAPAIFSWEVHNALFSVERRGMITREDHDDALLALSLFGIRVDESISAAEVRAQVGFAREAGLSLFDSAYLSQALARGCGLASRDTGLLVAAMRAGVECHDLRAEVQP